MSAEDHKSNAGGASKVPEGTEPVGLGEGERAEIRQRSAELGKRLEQVRGTRPARGADGKSQSILGQGMKMAIDLVAGVVVGFGIGWALDRAFNTRPILMVLFILLGFAAGMANLLLTARRMHAQVAPVKQAAPPVRDDSEDEDARR